MTTFAPLFVPAPVLDAVSARAWIAAMLEFERALAKVEAAADAIPSDAAEAISQCSLDELGDLDELLVRGRSVGNPVEPFVRALRASAGASGRFVHFGATSQDVMDSAAMLVSRRALSAILDDLDRVADRLAALADEHRSTPMAARTLLQQALPTTFGFKAAGWLVAVLEARQQLAELRTARLAVQFGGAVGTQAALGERGPDILRELAIELGLSEPILPWHTDRTRIVEVGAALDVASGVLAKIGLDLALLAQTEVGEVREQGEGGSSTLPQKRNPVGSTLARACAELVRGYASVLARASVQEHERAIGVWHAEWDALSGALAYTGGAAAAIADALDGLEVDVARMRRNLDLTEGLVVAERVAFVAFQCGTDDAQELVRAAALRAARSGRSFEEELRADERIGLSDDQLTAALDPCSYLGAAEVYVDRALEVFGRQRKAES